MQLLLVAILEPDVFLNVPTKFEYLSLFLAFHNPGKKNFLRIQYNRFPSSPAVVDEISDLLQYTLWFLAFKKQTMTVSTFPLPLSFKMLKENLYAIENE